jgi:hypothetical protein
MKCRLGCAAGLTALLLAWAPVATAQAPPATKAPDDARALADKIDQHFAQRWADAKIKPATEAGDAEFLRRVYLDLAGRIPSVPEARAFLADTKADKRARLVEQLLAGPRYVSHFTNVWRALLIPEANNNFLVRLQQGDFEAWLKKRVSANVGYDEMARDLLTAPIAAQGFGISLGGNGAPNPVAYYSAKEFKPEMLAAGTAKIFLGVSVECAQCHNHPFAQWKKEQFWSFAAFYSGVKSQRAMDFLLPAGEDAFKKSITMPGTKPGTEKVVEAKFLDGSNPKWKADVGSRATLAEWVTSPENPYFSRTAVNRTWAYFFGTGLIEPIDEIAEAEAANNHATLLDLVAKEFAEHKFDVKFLIRAITATRIYQLSSAGKDKNLEEPSLFARMPLRGMTGEQLFDSVVLATGYRDSGSGGNDLFSALTGGGKSARAEFLAKFGDSTERSTKVQTSILQALSLMNGKVIADATSLERSETLAALLDAPFMTTAERVEALYLCTLSRLPTGKERDRMVRFVDDAVKRGSGATTAYNNAMADVFWALLNSSEFTLNH